jgi:glycerophosphoryl diester phosphodiesterase
VSRGPGAREPGRLADGEDLAGAPRAAHRPGPPWILGHRGSPREAPENTLVSLRRALDHGLDGVEYDVHGTADGEPLLLHDDTLERTTDGQGAIAAKSSSEVLQLDAGGWFHKRFAGEPLPLLEEALALGRGGEGDPPWHMVELKESGLVERVAQLVAEYLPERRLRVASFHRDVCLAARDAGLPTMLLAVEASERDREFVRRERLDAHGLSAAGWLHPAGQLSWPCERWAWSVDRPADLLAACRAPLFGFNTNEPRRALAVRDLVALAPDDRGPYPLEVPRLEVPGAAGGQGHGEWAGHWHFAVEVRNPLPHEVRVELGFVGRHGAYEIRGEPTDFALAAGARQRVELELRGGSWSPGPDPTLVARLRYGAGPGRAAGELVLDAPLERSRTAVLRDGTLRLVCLRESPDARPPTIGLRRRGAELHVTLESPGDLLEAELLVHLDGSLARGGRGLRLRLPPDFERRPGGVPFSAGAVGRDPRRPGAGPSHRRWAGGLPGDLLSGEPGRLVLPG